MGDPVPPGSPRRVEAVAVNGHSADGYGRRLAGRGTPHSDPEARDGEAGDVLRSEPVATAPPRCSISASPTGSASVASQGGSWHET